MPFVKGQSGNPAGRPVGSPNKHTRVMQEALEESGPALIQQVLLLAAQGNTGAMRQCLDRLMGKQRPSAVELPSPDSPNYVIDALKEIHRALGAGEIASEEAIRLVDFVGRTSRLLAAKVMAEIDFAERLARGADEALRVLKTGQPAAAHDAAWKAAVQLAVPEPAIENNNAETMAPAPAQADAPAPTATPEAAPIDNNNGITMDAAAVLDEAIRATLPPRRESVKERLLAEAA